MCVDMMVTAVGQTCYLNDIPFMSILVISNKANDITNINNYTSVDILTSDLGDILTQFLSYVEL